MTSTRALALSIAMLVTACGGAAPALELRSTQNPLACTGRHLEDSVEIPELGRLPSGGAVTSGIALSCTDDELHVMQWGPDSSASYVLPRAHAMEIWVAFQIPATLDERCLRVLMLVDRAQR